jgi:replicative DNA helicase
MAEQVTAKKDAKTQQLKVPPHSFEAEQSVLGGLMLDNEAWDRVAERVIDKDFYSRPHRLIFQAMTRLSNAGNPIDLITLQEELERSEQLEEAGGFAYLVEIAKNTPSAANISAYAEIVRERAVVREMISVANEIVEAGYEPQGRTSGDLLDLAESKVFQIAEQRSSANEGPQPSSLFSSRPSTRLKSCSRRPTTA